MQNFLGLLQRLTDRKVDYVLVGGLAAGAHGSSMLTQDVDVVCVIEPANLVRLHQALADLNPLHRMARPRRPFLVEEARSTHFRNLYLHTDLGQLDCLGEIKGIGDYQAVKSVSVDLDLGDFICPVLSLDALIQAKEAMARPRDLENAKILRAIRDQLPKDG